MSTTSTPLTFASYEDAAHHVTSHAPNARELSDITAHLDSDLHTVWLDAGDGTVWHAWTDPDLNADGWTLDREPAADAQRWIEEQLTNVLDRLAAPEGINGYAYAGPNVTVDDDLDVLAEYEAVQLAAVGTQTEDPAVADRIIRGRIDRLKDEISRLARLRGVHLTAAYGSGHGSAARAARALDISHESARQAMAAPDAYAARARAGAANARQLVD